MAIESVNLSAGAQASATRIAADAQPAERRQPPPPPPERQEEAQRPVVNSEGQTTGTVINTTA